MVLFITLQIHGSSSMDSSPMHGSRHPFFLLAVGGETNGLGLLPSRRHLGPSMELSLRRHRYIDRYNLIPTKREAIFSASPMAAGLRCTVLHSHDMRGFGIPAAERCKNVSVQSECYWRIWHAR